MDAYALPRIDELLEGLGGNQFYTVLDMKSGYHQVELEEDQKVYTAFTAGPLGFYEYNRFPFGLSNEQVTYQRLMESCLSELIFGENGVCQIYLDDGIIASKTFEEHLQCSKEVFFCCKFQGPGLKHSPEKCKLFQSKAKYVGRVISTDGIETNTEKKKQYPVGQYHRMWMRSERFLGFTGYYRRFVQGYSSIAKPPNLLLVGIKNKKKYFRKAKLKVETSSKGMWDEAQ